MDYTALAAWVGIVVAIVVLIAQNQSAKKLTCLQLFLQLADRYDSDEMNRRRARLARTLLANRETLEIDDTILVFFENVALMMRRGLLDSDLTWNTFGIDVSSYWGALKGYVLAMRETFNDDSLYSEFQWLAGDMRALTLDHAGPDSRMGNDDDEEAITKFLEMEARRSLELASNASETLLSATAEKRKIQQNNPPVSLQS